MRHVLFIITVLFLEFIFSPFSCYSQKNLKVIVRAENGAIYFYKKDSTIINKDTFFYLVCKESQKKNVLVLIENARLVSDANDSLVYAEYLPGLKYEAWFVEPIDSMNSGGEFYSKRMQLHSFLNGTSTMDKNQIRIQIFLRKENELIFDTNYNYKD